MGRRVPSALLGGLVVAAGLVAVPTAHAAQTSSLTGLTLHYDYLLAEAAEGCPETSGSGVTFLATGEGPAFQETAYEEKWSVNIDVATPDGELLATVGTDTAYAATYDGPMLYIELRCDAAADLLEAGYGAGQELRFSVTSALYDEGAIALETSAATTEATPKRVVVLEPELAVDSPRGGRKISTRLRMWSAVDDGYGWADPLEQVPVKGFWRGCSARTVRTATDGSFTVTWRKPWLVRGREFGYFLPGSRTIGLFYRGWTIKGPAAFRLDPDYEADCASSRG